MTALVILILCLVIAWASLVKAHNADRHEGHGDCASIAASQPFDWELHGTSSGDNCNGHDTRDLITVDGGKDSVKGEAQGDDIRGGDDADTLNAGNGNDDVFGVLRLSF